MSISKTTAKRKDAGSLFQGKQGNSKLEKIEVTVIPVDEDPYSKNIAIPHHFNGISAFKLLFRSDVSIIKFVRTAFEFERTLRC